MFERHFCIELRVSLQVPSALNKWAAIVTITTMILLAVGIEVALHFSQKKQGMMNGFSVDWIMT